jgi:hypothetical protein
MIAGWAIMMVVLFTALIYVSWRQADNEYKRRADIESRIVKLESECHKH